ncbi:glycosyltransferase [Candidatus Pacearchaeota archaeon]|nr:glycosyltransferase [Candidatus Pacearchaeota archaeon]
MKDKISVVTVIHNEENIIKRCLDSVKDIADEILIVHDGPCNDKTIEICKKYTKNIFVRTHKGLPAMHLAYLFRKVKNNWILKIDADEFLSKPLQKDILNLIKNKRADAYEFNWPYWNGEKYATRDWPKKIALYRKSKISYLGFPHWDTPEINGNIIKSNYQLEHRHFTSGAIPTWKEFREKAIGRYLRLQAEYTIKDFKELDSFQYSKKDFPIQMKIRRNFPLLSAFPFAIGAGLKILLSKNAWKEGPPVFAEAFGCVIYYFYLGVYIHKLKTKSQKD